MIGVGYAVAEALAPGDRIMVHVPGQRRAYEHIVREPRGTRPLPGMVRAGRPSRQWPGDFISSGWVCAEWIVEVLG